MSPIIPRFRSGGKKAFSLVEVITSSLIIVYIVTALWSIYIMGWKWWHETSPVVESQRIARIALSTIMEGTTDTTTGQETIGFETYKGRSGISWITRTSDTLPDTPLISSDDGEITYMLEGDTQNVRRFYIGQDAVTGMKALYSLDGDGVIHKVKATEIDSGHGDIRLTFTPDPVYTNVIKAEVRVERRVPATIYETSPIVAEYSDTIYMRNI